MERFCKFCQTVKTVDDFYAHKKSKDGRSTRCKECTKLYEKNRRQDPRFRDAILAYDRARGSRQTNAYVKEYRARYPNKYRAHNLVNNSLRDKKLFKESCCICGRKDTIEAHHDDYAKPLNVKWMCSAHHKQWHMENGEGLNP